MENEHLKKSVHPKDQSASNRSYLKDVLLPGDASMSIVLDLLQTASKSAEPYSPSSLKPAAPLLDAPVTHSDFSCNEAQADLPELGLDVYVDDWLYDEATGILNIVFTREAANFDLAGFGKLTFAGVRDYAYEWVDDSEPEEEGGWKDVLPESFVDLVTPDQGTDGRYYLLTNAREVSFKAEGPPAWAYIH
jgi:hypothetical protein